MVDPPSTMDSLASNTAMVTASTELSQDDPLLKTTSLPLTPALNAITHTADGHIRKSGSRVRVEEGKALQFAHTLNVPVPEVYDIGSIHDNTYINMEQIDGQTLDEVWPSMDLEQKQTIAADLKQLLITMRDAVPTQQTIGAIDGLTRDCCRFKDHTGGPFAQEEQFNAFLLDISKGTPKMIRDLIGARMPTGSRLAFTHGDLSPGNIIVEHGYVKALLGWEHAGWYPEYWEFVKFFERPTPCKDWKNFAEDIFEDVYPHELVTFQLLACWQDP